MSNDKNFLLISEAIRQNKSVDMVVNLGVVEEIIGKKIPELFKYNTPTEYFELYTEFKSEYDSFRDFILYDKLIGKNIVALGGGFSSGKSSFLNSFNGENALPEDIDPSTSVPTYIVNGEKHSVQGINIFDTKIEIETRNIKKIAHGFGEVLDDDGEIVSKSVTLGHILESIFLSSPKQQYKNIAFLDTPGYSKPDSEKYSAKTDEQIARGQLNTSNYILWFVQADAGTITEEDIRFIKSLREDIPKLIILNKADKKTDADIKAIIEKIKQTLDLKGVRYVDVFSYSNIDKDLYNSAEIRKQIENWNDAIYEANFAKNFKVLFYACKEYYENQLEDERRRLNRLNTAVTKISISDDYSDVVEPLQFLVKEIQRNTKVIVDTIAQLKDLQNEFFTEIKKIGDTVGIKMPEPSEIDLISDKVNDPFKTIKEYNTANGIKTNTKIYDILSINFDD